MADRSGRPPADLDPAVTLDMLDAVAENADVSQRDLARALGIALGLVNTYLKRCINKGWIKAQQVPANRYAYYLTPQGFTEKTRLTTEYLRASFAFFRRARGQCERLFERAADRGLSRLALAGCGDLAEIAVICRRDPVVLVAVLDGARASAHGAAGPAARSFAGLPVVSSLDDVAVDGVLITDLEAPQATFDRLAADWPADRLLTPAVLKILRDPLRPPTDEEARHV